MDISLTETLKAFVRAKVESGEFGSEDAVVATALQQLRDRETAALTELIDHDFVADCEQEGNGNVTLEEVLQATSLIPGSMARSIIEDERADRF